MLLGFTASFARLMLKAFYACVNEVDLDIQLVFDIFYHAPTDSFAAYIISTVIV